jgi:16S rRNA (guanine966-N2)-methyltransferase
VSRRSPHRIRLIGGHWRGRSLTVLDRPGLRPSGDRTRETLFNWLQSELPGAVCLDLFAGTGALGLEAASRGAARVDLVERDRVSARHLEDLARGLDPARVRVYPRDALHFLDQPPEQPYDGIFLDPPFTETRLLEATLERLDEPGWLRSPAWVYLETRTRATPPVPASWQATRERTMGEVTLRLYRCP